MSESGVILEPPPSVGSDVSRALSLYHLLCPNSDDMQMAVILGAPKSKARPRSGKHNFYDPSRPHQTALAEFLVARRLGTRAGNVALGAIFFRPNHQRMDVDNALKLVLDAGTQAQLWNDDSQVTALVGIMEFDPLRPRTVILLGEHESTLDRSPKRRTYTCVSCGQPFYRPTVAVKGKRPAPRWCSFKCRAQAMRKPPRVPVGRGVGPKGQAPPTCVDCGAPVSKRGYLRCRACWKTARRKVIG